MEMADWRFTRQQLINQLHQIGLTAVKPLHCRINRFKCSAVKLPSSELQLRRLILLLSI